MENFRHRARRFLSVLKPGAKDPSVMDMVPAVDVPGAGSGELVAAELEVGHQCPNCHVPLDGEFCPGCGQKNVSLLRPIWYLIADLTEDIISRDSKLWRTLGQIIFLPGTMTRDFMEGRRARFVPPIRLYLLSTLAFFLTLYLTDIAILKLEVHDRGPVDNTEQREQAFVSLQEELANSGMVFIPAPEQVEDIAVLDVPDVPDASTPLNIPEEDFEEMSPEMQEDMAELSDMVDRLQDVQHDIVDAVRESGGEGSPELMEALQRLERIADEQGMTFEMSDDMDEAQLLELERVLEQGVDNYRDASLTGERIFPIGDRLYGMDVQMFVPAQPSDDAVALPSEAFEEQHKGLDEQIAKLEEDDGFALFMMQQAGRAMDGAIAASESPRRLNNSLNDWLSKAMIVLLPIFALLLRFFYWGKANNLMKQFVFSLHFHTFIFLVMTFLVVSSKFWDGAVSMGLFFLVGPLYLLAGMKVASRQGWFRTIFKFAMVSFFYVVILALTVGTTLLMTFADV